MEFIILTEEQAEAVRGESVPGHELFPLNLADGETFVLPVGVLDAPEHSIHHAMLAGLPRRPVAADEWPAPVEDID